MKVLMPVLHYYPVIGGLETWTKNIAEGLADRAEIFVVTGKVHLVKSREAGIPQSAELFNGVKIFRASLFALRNLSHSSLFYILTALPFIFFKSFSLISSQKIDLLHCNGFLGSCLGCCLSLVSGVPYIVTVQRLEGGSFFKKLIYKKAALCIGASRAVGEYFKEIGCKDVEVIPNGIDSERFKNIERKPHEGFAIMTIARLEKVKGVEYLIGALSRLSLPERLSLIIIGDGSERKNLDNLVKKFGLTDKVKFLGEIHNRKIPEYLAMADCFVLPSLKEGFGIAILEAMAARVPVIASRVGGILDIIEDGKTGLLVEPRNSEEIAKAINKIYQDSSSREQLINNAMVELKRYDWQSIANKVYKLYEDTIRYGNISA